MNVSDNARYSAIFLSSEKIKKEKGWLLYGFGESFSDKTSKINISFLVKRHIFTVEEARMLIVEGVQGFLEEINHLEDPRQSLDCQLFTQDMLSFSLSFGDDDNLMNGNNEIAYVSLINGKLAYSIDGGKKLNRVHQETFEEALKIVELEKQQKSLLVSEPF